MHTRRSMPGSVQEVKVRKVGSPPSPAQPHGPVSMPFHSVQDECPKRQPHLTDSGRHHPPTGLTSRGRGPSDCRTSLTIYVKAIFACQRNSIRGEGPFATTIRLDSALVLMAAALLARFLHICDMQRISQRAIVGVPDGGPIGLRNRVDPGGAKMTFVAKGKYEMSLPHLRRTVKTNCTIPLTNCGNVHISALDLDALLERLERERH